PNGGRMEQSNGAGQPCPNAIVAGVTAETGAKMERLTAVVTTRGFERRTNVVALRRPADQPAFKSGISHAVGSAGRAGHFDVIEQTLALAQQNNLQIVGRIGAVVEHVGGLDVGPGRFAGLVTVGPV